MYPKVEGRCLVYKTIRGMRQNGAAKRIQRKTLVIALLVSLETQKRAQMTTAAIAPKIAIGIQTDSTSEAFPIQRKK
jgi:hypothetical protein